METKTTESEMLTAGKLAEKMGVPPAKIKKAIQELALEPDMKKCNCGYYNAESAAKIKKALGV